LVFDLDGGAPHLTAQSSILYRPSAANQERANFSALVRLAKCGDFFKTNPIQGFVQFAPQTVRLFY